MNDPVTAIANPRERAPVRIAYMATVAIPSRQTDTEQVVRTVDALWAAGVQTDLIVPAAPDRHGGDGERAIKKFYHVKQGFKVISYPCMTPIVLGAERILCAMIAGFKHAGSYDIVHTRSRGITLISLLKGQPVVFETYRDLSKTAPWFLRVLRFAARSDNFLGLVTHSHFASAGIAKVAALEGKMHVVHNGYDPAVYEPAYTQKAARQHLGFDPDRKMVVYAGNVQRGKGMSMLLDIAAGLAEVSFVIVGGADSHLKELAARIKDWGCENVHLAGWKRHDELGIYLHAADIVIIPPSAAPLERFRRTVLPMKTFLLMGAGRVIVAPDTPDIAEVLHDKNAVLVPADDTGKAVAAIKEVLSNPKKAQLLSRAALATARRFTWSARAEKLKHLYKMWHGESDPK